MIRTISMATDDHWAALTCVAVEKKKTMEELGPGVFQNKTTTIVFLECLCGKTIEMELGEFPGKRLMLDCGCGIAKKKKEDGGTRREMSVLITFNLPEGEARALEDYRMERGLNRARAIRELMSKGLEQIANLKAIREAWKEVESTDAGTEI